MTSFTRKLYEVYPHAAEEIRRQSYRDYRYGKHVTLAEFTPAHHSLPPKQPVPCPHKQTFCIRNGLSQHDCPICKNWKPEAELGNDQAPAQYTQYERRLYAGQWWYRTSPDAAWQLATR